MIRLLHTSDSHWDDRGRLEDVADVHYAMLVEARRLGVDLFIHAGDFFDKRSTPTERTALAGWLKAAAEIAPVWGCKGNHDAAGDLEIFNRLETDHPVWIEERVTAAPGSGRILDLGLGRRVGLLAMAWIDKAHLVSGQAVEVDQEQTRQMAIAGVRDLLTCIRAEASRLRAAGAAPILATHVMLGGSVVSTGQILIGQGIDLSPTDLADLGAAYVACGHIHATQAWHGGRVAYSGSPSRHTFGESEPKGFRLVTLTDEGEFVSNEFVELPARRIVLIFLVSETPEHAKSLPHRVIRKAGDVRGALVRVRYQTRPEDLHLVDAEEMERVLLEAGAEEIQLEAVVAHQARVRSEEITRTTSTAEKVEAFFRAKGIEVDAATAERLHGKIADLEGVA